MTQCLMKHEDAKIEKPKTRRLLAIDETNEYTWQKGDAEIQQIKKDIEEGKSWKYRMESGVVMTIADKIWIPKAKNR